MSGEITPDTHFRAPLARVVVIALAIASATGAGVGAWAALNGKLEGHLLDKERHLDPDWQKDHGRPVGKFDLDVSRAEMNRRMDDFAAAQSRMEGMIRDATFPARQRKARVRVGDGE